MTEPRPILYGVSDYAEIRKANAWFVDRTAKLRDLEKVRYAIFLRPRRFGKSLLCSLLHAYYDVNCESRFQTLFAETDIGRAPTDEHNKYLVLSLNFSGVRKAVDEVQASFETYVSGRINAFTYEYESRLPSRVVTAVPISLARRNSRS